MLVSLQRTRYLRHTASSGPRTFMRHTCTTRLVLKGEGDKNSRAEGYTVLLKIECTHSCDPQKDAVVDAERHSPLRPVQPWRSGPHQNSAPRRHPGVSTARLPALLHCLPRRCTNGEAWKRARTSTDERGSRVRQWRQRPAVAHTHNTHTHTHTHTHTTHTHSPTSRRRDACSDLRACAPATRMPRRVNGQAARERQQRMSKRGN
jgi:hypothetical protein